MHLKIGTRKSNLALIQTELVINEFKKKIPDFDYEIVKIETSGDRILDRNLYDIGGKALFLKEIEEQLLKQTIDIAVHSLKDVPGVIDQRLSIAATLAREDPRDCFISHKYKSLAEMPVGSILGSSSMRRKTLIEAKYPQIKMIPFRGNINSRLEKLHNNEVDATILACAGLARSNLFNTNYCHPMGITELLPAAGQGIIAVQVRNKDLRTKKLCSLINHQPSWHLAKAERAFLTCLDASCRTPISAYAHYDQEIIKASYMLADDDGKNIRYCHTQGPISAAKQLGIQAAMELMIKNHPK